MPVAALLAIVAPGLDSPSSLRFLAQGLWGGAFLGVFLGSWLLGFRIATLPVDSDDEGVTRRLVAGSAIVLLVLLYLGGAGHLIVRLLAAVAVAFGIAGMVSTKARLGRTGTCAPAPSCSRSFSWAGSARSLPAAPTEQPRP